MDGGRGVRRAGGGQAERPVPHSGGLRRADRPPGGRPQGHPDPAGRGAGKERLGPGGGRVPGRLHRLHPPGAAGAAPAAAPVPLGDGLPDLRPRRGGRGGLRGVLPGPQDRPPPAGAGEGRGGCPGNPGAPAPPGGQNGGPRRGGGRPGRGGGGAPGRGVSGHPPLRRQHPLLRGGVDGLGDPAPGAGGGLPLPGHRGGGPEHGGVRPDHRDGVRPLRGARVPQPHGRHSAKAHPRPHHRRPGHGGGGLPLRRPVPLPENRPDRPFPGGVRPFGELRPQVGPEGGALDPEGGLDHAPPGVRPALAGGGHGPFAAPGRYPPPGGGAAGEAAPPRGAHRAGAGGGPLRLSGGHRSAGSPHRAQRRPAGAGGTRPGRRVRPALGHPLRRPGAVRGYFGGGPHGAGRVRPALLPGALPVRRGGHPRVPGPPDGGGDAPAGPQALQGAVPAGGGRRVHPPGGPLAGAFERRRQEPAVLLRHGAGPLPDGQALPGEHHRVRDLRPALTQALRELGRRRAGGGGAPPGPSGVPAAGAVPRAEGVTGGGPGRLLPSGGPQAGPGAGGPLPRRRGGAEGPAGVRPPGGADGAGGGA